MPNSNHTHPAMARSKLIVLVACLHSATTAAFATGIRPHVAHSTRNAALVISPGRGQSRWTGTRGGRRRRAACSMSSELGDTVRYTGLLGLDGQACRSVTFNSRTVRGWAHQPDRPSRRPRGLGVTTLRSVNTGIEDVGETAEASDGSRIKEGREPASAAVVEGGETTKGWNYWSYRVLLLGVAAIWGTNFPVVKFVESHGSVSDATAAFVRFSIAAAAMLPFADFGETEVLLAGMEIGAWVAFGYFTQAIGLQTSDASVCAFLCSLTVVFVPLLDTLTGKGIKLITVVASFLALLGTGFLELGDAHASFNDLWCVAQAAGFGVAFTRIEHYMKKYPGKSLQLSIGQLISVAGLTGLWCAYSTGGHLPDFSFMKDRSIAAALGYTGLVTTSLAVWLETIALEQVPAAEMSVIFSTEPLWATLVSGVFLKETMGPNALVGAGFILLACITAQSEQIMELLGMGEGVKSDKIVTPEAFTLDVSSDDSEDEAGDEDAGHTTGQGSGSGGEGLLPTSILDEVEPSVRPETESSSFRVSVFEEFDVMPIGVYAEGSSSAVSVSAKMTTTASSGRGADLGSSSNGSSGGGGGRENESPAVPVGWLASPSVPE